jgi:hypothetical protein
MSILTIGGQAREVRFAVEEIQFAEKMIIKNDGRAIMDILGNEKALFTLEELEWLLWAAWRKQMSAANLKTVLAQFYAEGGTVFDVNSAVLDALLDSGVYGRRRENGADPQTATDPART